MISNLQIEVIQTSLAQMMRKGHFDICCIRKILEITGGTPNREDWSALELLHCVDFKDFPPRLRLEFPKLLERVLMAPAMKLTIRYEPLESLPALRSVNVT